VKQLALPLSVDEARMAVYAAWTEDMLLRNVINTARAARYLTYHTRYSLKSSAGFPDLVLVGGPEGDRLLFAELKRQGKWPTEGRFARGVLPRWIVGQRDWLRSLNLACAEVYLWWPSDIHDISTILVTGPRPGMDCVLRIEEYLRDDGDEGDPVRPDGRPPVGRDGADVGGAPDAGGHQGPAAPGEAPRRHR
jgi:hypothetical protein